MNTVRLLLVEDDVISAHFLGEVLASLPATVVQASTCAEALDATRGGLFDLWLIDANLPDGTAEGLLESLRAQLDAHAGALALTADPFPERRERLLAAGFLEVLQKPLEARQLHVAVCAHLRGIEAAAPRCVREESVALWDDAQALHAAGGKPESVAALRALFARELPLDRERVREALRKGDADALQDTLHRLKASCGFVGASGLLGAVQALSRAPGDPARQAEFETACRSTLAGL